MKNTRRFDKINILLNENKLQNLIINSLTSTEEVWIQKTVKS